MTSDASGKPVHQALDWLLELAESGWRLAHVLSRLGQVAVRPERRRSHGACVRALHACGEVLEMTSSRGLIARHTTGHRNGRCNISNAHQRPDGSWIPLWFGNQDHPDEENPIYGTAKVLLAYRDTGRMREHPAAQSGFEYLMRSQNADGGWGGGAAVRNAGQRIGNQPVESTIEETALAVEALLADNRGEKIAATANRGVAWLIAAVENGRLFDRAPIGFYFAKLWYYERLYPLTVYGFGVGPSEKKYN